MWFSPYKGNKYFPGLHIHDTTCLLHHLLFKTCMWHRKGWGARNGVWWYPKCLDLTFFADPIESFFSFLSFSFYLAKEADGPNFEPKLLVGVPKVSQHDIDDWNLIDFGSINLHHSLSVALPRLQKQEQKSESDKQSQKNTNK